MALYTNTWDEFKAHVEGFCGSGLRSEEWERIRSNANFAAKRAYRRSQWWERYLVTAEPRTLSRNEIQSTEDSFHVYGAGTDAVNGLYVRDGSGYSSTPSYTKYDSDGTTKLYYLQRVEDDGSNVWYIYDASAPQILVPAVPNGTLYVNNSTASTPPTEGWTASGDGVTPAPLLVDVADIDTFLQVDRYDIFQDRTSRPCQGHAVNGRFILHSDTDDKIVYVTYKKAHTDVYGDGTMGTTSTIPSEWFNYMALHASYMYLASTRQSNPNGYSGVAYREVESALEDELMRIEEQGLSNVAQRVSTHLAYNTSLT